MAALDRLLRYPTAVSGRAESHRLKDKERAGVFAVPTARPSA